MSRSTFSGPIKSNAGIEVGSSGSTVSLIKTGSVSVVVSALAAAAEEDVTVTISGAAAGDKIVVTPPNAAAETGLAVLLAWVSAADTVKIRLGNLHTSALTGSTSSWSYVLIR